MNERAAWRWQNIPVPEAHLAGFGASLLLHAVWPRRLGPRAALRASGAMLLTAGTTLVVWAIRSAGTTAFDRPDQLVTTGAYAHIRNPMYVGWTLAYIGTGALGNTAWPLIMFPAVAAAVHREIGAEERRLADRFAADYRAYAGQVRRYV